MEQGKAMGTMGTMGRRKGFRGRGNTADKPQPLPNINLASIFCRVVATAEHPAPAN